MNSPVAPTPAYVPILKWKMGEQSAVKLLDASVRGKILPIAEIQDRPFDFENDKFSKTWEQHLGAVCKSTLTRWGTENEIAIDQPIAQEDTTAGGKSAWAFLFEQLWSDSVRAVPSVSSLAGASEVEALAALSAVAGRNRWLLRYEYQPNESPKPPPGVLDIADWFRSTVRKLSSSHSAIDAVIDVGFMSADANLTPDFWAEVVRAVSLQGPWKSLTLAAGAFPENLAGLTPGIHQVRRRDWAFYKEVRVLLDSKHEILFGDYGVNYTDTFDADPRLMRMSANLRYTHLESWFVFKARSVKDFGFGQYRELCALLINLDPPFMGAEFSEGDASYFAVATDPNAGPGNATVWRRDATNHHIHMVLSQLRQLG